MNSTANVNEIIKTLSLSFPYPLHSFTTWMYLGRGRGRHSHRSSNPLAPLAGLVN